MTTLGVFLLPAIRAPADQSPPGCTQNNLALDIGRDKTWIFGCSRQITMPGTFVDHAAEGGIDVEENRAGPPEATQVSATVQPAQVLPATRGPLKGAIPVTGLALPVTALGTLGLVLIGMGVFLDRRGPLRNR